MLKRLLPFFLLVFACSDSPSDDPGRAERLQVAWGEFHQFVVERYPDIDFQLNPGADAARISAAEKAIGRRFSPELRVLYSLADGQDPEGFSLFPGHRFLPLEEIGPQVELMNSWSFLFFRFLPAEGDPGVKNWWWDNDWLPVGENGAGDLFCVDFAPASGGNAGQLIEFIHDDSPRRRYAAGLAEYFEDMPDGLENGNWLPYLEWKVFLSRAEAGEYGILFSAGADPGAEPSTD